MHFNRGRRALYLSATFIMLVVLAVPIFLDVDTAQNTTIDEENEVHDDVQIDSPNPSWAPSNFLSTHGANLQQAYDVAIGIDGSIYVSNYNRNNILVFSPEGVFVRTIGYLGSGDGQFNKPTKIEINSTGYLYVCDLNNYRVQVFDQTGNFVRKWGSYGTGSGQFTSLYGIGINSTGHVYVSDKQNNSIKVFDQMGNFVRKFGTSGSGNGQFSSPSGLCINSTGHVYVADSSNKRIQIFDQNGNYIAKWGSVGTGDGQFSYPVGITINSTGFSYVVDSTSLKIQVFDPNRNFVTKWGGTAGTGIGQFNTPQDIQIDTTDSTYIADYFNNRIQIYNHVNQYVSQLNNSNPWMVITPNDVAINGSNNIYGVEYGRVQVFDHNYRPIRSWGSWGSATGYFNQPKGIAINATGYVYVSDTSNRRIQVFDQNGGYIRMWGSDGDGDEQFKTPMKIAINATGYVYVVDMTNNRIQIFDQMGNYIAKWGSLGNTQGLFNNPKGIDINATGCVYVADSTNNRIQVFDQNGRFIRFWGSAGAGDGQFNRPDGVAINSTGYVYVTDSNNNRVQVFDQNGVYISQWGTLGASDSQFNLPVGIEINSTNHIFVVDYNNNRIQTFGDRFPYVDSIGLSPSHPTTRDYIELSYDFHDPDGDSEEDTEILWYKNNIYQPEWDNEKQVQMISVSKGEKWNATIHPSDGNMFGSIVVSPTLTIVNTIPIVENITLNPYYPKSNENLVLDYDYLDADGDSEGLTEILWYKNNVHQVYYDNETEIPFSELSDGDDWNATIKPYDGYEYGSLYFSQTVTVGNVLPTIDNLVITPSNPKTSNYFVLDYDYHDLNDDLEDLTEIIWYKEDIRQNKYDNLKQINASDTLKGEIWNATIRPHDGEEYGLLYSVYVNIRNTAPIVENITLTPNNPITRDYIYLNYDYADNDSDIEGMTEIVWYKDNVHQPEFDNDKMVPILSVTKGEKWNATIRPYDGSSFGEPKASLTLIISNTIPMVENISLTPMNPITSENLVLDYDYLDADGDSEGLTEILWYRDNVHESDFDNLHQVDADATSKGEQWKATIRPFDGIAYGDICYTLILSIGNTAPIVENITLTPNNPKTKDFIYLNYDYADNDSHSEGLTEILWYKNNIYQPDFDNETRIQILSVIKGEKWNATIRPFDGFMFGELVASPILTIVNTIPIIENITLSPLSPKTQDNLVLDYDYLDADGDTEGLTEILWYKNNDPQSEFNNLRQVDASATAKGEKWNVTIRPFDGIVYGDICITIILVIGNTVPIVENITLTPTNPTTSEILVLDYDYEDVDTDSEGTTEIFWYRNNIHQLEYDNLTQIPVSVTIKGEVWNVTIRPSDGYNLGSLYKSITVTIQNTAPEISDVFVIPESYTTISQLHIYYLFSDKDNDDSDEIQISWYKNGVHMPELDDSEQVATTYLIAGDNWTAEVRISDGAEFSEWVESVEIEIISSSSSNNNSSNMELITAIGMSAGIGALTGAVIGILGTRTKLKKSLIKRNDLPKISEKMGEDSQINKESDVKPIKEETIKPDSQK
jgi:sugar lactone lactonase YvrE